MPAAADTTGTQKEPPVAKVVNRSGQSKIVLICEHASKHIPGVFGDLGLTETAKISHAAWDIGAQELAEQMSVTLDAMLVLNTVSRLVYDCNRAPAAPDAMPSQSEQIVVPGNRGLSQKQKLHRIKIPTQMLDQLLWLLFQNLKRQTQKHILMELALGEFQ